MQPELLARGPGGSTSDDHAPSMQRVFEEIERQVGDRNFEHWFRNKVALAFEGREVVLRITSAFLLAWMQKNFFAQVADAVRATLGGDFIVRFALGSADAGVVSASSAVAAPVTTQRQAAEPQSHAESPAESAKAPLKLLDVPSNESPSAPVAEQSAPPPAKETHKSGTRRFADLADFIQGSCNELALTAAKQICNEPGVRFNPLVIYGDAGTGKTHLLEGIYRMMRRRHPSQQVMYLTAEAFSNYFTQALKEHTLPAFRQRFRGVDVLLIDDVDFFDGKRVFQEEFLHTFQQLESHGRQIVVSSDRHPRLLTKLTNDLSTRFVSGLVCKIESPDLETRQKIVEHKAARLGDAVAPEALAYIAQKFRNNVRELEGGLNQLESHHFLTRKRVTLATARQIISEHERDTKRPVRITDVEQVVCQFFGVAPADLKSERRQRAFSEPRMLAMFLIRKHTHAAYSQIGEHFGGRNHSTVMAAEKRLMTLAAAGDSIRVASRSWQIDELIDALEQQLQAC